MSDFAQLISDLDKEILSYQRQQWLGSLFAWNMESRIRGFALRSQW